MELEKSISGNFNILQNENDEKDFKYCNILRELEIKDTTISSLESMLIRKDQEISRLKESHRLFTGKDYNNYLEKERENSHNFIGLDYNENKEEEYISARNFPQENFNKDEENENELKNLVKGNNKENDFNAKSSILNYAISRENTNNSANVFEAFNNDNSKGSMKIPGRIFSNKKK